jgi:hypothetical protein
MAVGTNESGVPVLVDDRFRTVMGQDFPTLAPGQVWGMSSNRSAKRLDAHDVRLDTLEQLVTQLLVLSNASQEQQLVFAAQQHLATMASQQLATAQAAQDLRLAAVEAKATLTASATESNRLDILVLQANDVLLQARATQDETAIAKAQTTANQAVADAAKAQTTANQDAKDLLTVQGLAKAAQDTATAAQQSLATFAARFRSARVAVPKIDLGTSLDVVVQLSPAYADANYTAIAEPAGLALLGLDATEVPTARTASTVTFKIKNVLGLAIAAGGVLNFIAFHD